MAYTCTLGSEYTCKLNAASLEKAKAELREDPNNREGAVETLRKWIRENPWLKTPTDTGFLLRFLRTKKYSQLEARKALENYWKARTINTLWFSNTDPREERLQAMLDSGFLLRLPKTDKDGQTYIIGRFGTVDPDHVKKKLGGAETIFRFVTCIMDWMCMDERIQVDGLVYIADLSGYTSGHRSLIHTRENIQKLGNTFQNVYPIRLKKVNMYNLPPLFEAVLTVMKTVMKEKLKSRVNIVGKNLVHLYERIDQSVLPIEYLPDDYEGENSGTIQNIIEQMKKEITQPEVVEHITNLSNGQYCVDMKMKPADQEPAQSFRKLNVD